MTALKQIERLESYGLWRPEPDAQRREVAVFFRDATLVLVDKAERPLSHWSLPAIERLNPADLPALYSPDPDGHETLEVEDSTLIDALETVSRSMIRPHPGRLRLWFAATALILVLLGVIFWLPGALREQVVHTLPPSARTTIDDRLIAAVEALTGPACTTPRGTQALSRLSARTTTREDPAPVVVIPAGLPASHPLPGGTILLGRDAVRDIDDPAITAGYILSAQQAAAHNDPLRPLLEHAGTLATLELMTTGSLSDRVIAREARALLREAPDAPAPDALAAAFRDAQMPFTPWADHANVTLPEITALENNAPSAPLLTDGDWLSLQAICD